MNEAEILLGGAMWSRRMRRGQTLRLTDTTGRAAVAALFYNADAPLERLNLVDDDLNRLVHELAVSCRLAGIDLLHGEPDRRE